MTGPPPVSNSQAPPPPQPFPVYSFPPHIRYKPNETFVPHLAYMEGQFAAQALLAEQQRRIKSLETELASTQMELVRLRTTIAASHAPVPNTRMHSHLRPDAAPLPVAVSPNAQQQDDAKKASSRYWTADEHGRFLEGLELFGQKDIKAIARHVGTRSATQVRTHAQKYYLRIERERAKAEAEGKPPPPVSNGKRPHSKSPKLTQPQNNSNQSQNASTAQSAANVHLSTSTSHSNSHHSSTSNHNRTVVMQNSRVDQSASPDQPVTTQIVPSVVPVQPLPYPSQPFLTAAVDAAVTTAAGASLSVPHLSCPSSSQLPLSLNEKQATSSISNAQTRNGLASSAAMLFQTVSVAQHNTIQSPAVKQELVTATSALPTESPSNRQKKVADRQQISRTVKDEPMQRQTGKRQAHSTHRRSPKKRAKKPLVPPSTRKTSVITPNKQSIVPEKQADHGKSKSIVKANKTKNGPLPEVQSCAATAQEVKMEVQPSAALPVSSPIVQSAPSKPPASVNQPPLPPSSKPLLESGGSMSNLRAFLKVPDDAGPSSSKPPTLRRNGSSNSVLADLAKNSGVLSRSNSFILSNGKGVTRSNSILSLLSGIPTTLRESPSTDRLLGLDVGEDKVLATLKAMDTGGGSVAGLGVSGLNGATTIGMMGDRSFSIGQLNQMGLDDLEDPGGIALALHEEQKWGDP